MKRKTGSLKKTTTAGEQVSAFVPYPLPPAKPPLHIDSELEALLAKADAALSLLRLAEKLVPSADWFLYGFARKEAVISSQIEGTQATLKDVLNFEATKQIAKPNGLPLSTRLLCGAHERLMQGVRGADKHPGLVRKSQNWIGGSRPGNAVFVPPPAEEVSPALAALDQWIHSDDDTPALLRVGMAHVQFETIHPFLDGNGRIGRLLVALLMEHWRLLDSPLLYISLALKQRQKEYYQRLDGVRSEGDWEAWLKFFIECVCQSADNGVQTAELLFSLVNKDRVRLLDRKDATLYAVRLLEKLPEHPIVTAALAIKILDTSKPTATKAVDALVSAGILHETTGKKRDRVYAYQEYLSVLTSDT